MSSQPPGIPGPAPQSIIGSFKLKAVSAKHAAGELSPTMALINAYSDEDGFHCPVCKQTIKNSKVLVDHIASEFNKSVENLQAAFESNKAKKPRIEVK